MIKFKQLGKRIISSVIGTTMVITSLGIPQISSTVAVHAEEVNTPEISAPSDTKYQSDFSKLPKYKKVYFGGMYDRGIQHKWYVAGKENNDLVLLCDPSTDYGKCQFGESTNAYENSALDTYIKQLYEGDNNQTYFTNDEKALMKSVNITFPSNCDYAWNNDAGISRKMYAPSAHYITETGVESDKVKWDRENVYVGGNESTIPMSLDKNKVDPCGGFWLRSPLYSRLGYSLYAYAMAYVECRAVKYDNAKIVPAMHIDLTKALFASSAKPVKNNSSFDSDAMTIRFDGNGKVNSVAIPGDDGITVTNPTNGEYLYVQWCENGRDKVKSFAIDANTTLYSAGIPNLKSDCKIWIEKKVNNVVYASKFAPIHVHDWEYIAEGSKLEAYCKKENCPTHTDATHRISLSLLAKSMPCSGEPADVEVGSSEEIIEWESALGEEKIPEVKYYKERIEEDKLLESAPVEVGSYVSTISPVGEEATEENTAVVEFEIYPKGIYDVFGNSVDKYSKVYFGGKYYSSIDHRWYVAGVEDGKLVLLCDPSTNYGQSIFDDDTNIYANSILDNYVQDLYADNSEYFTKSEKGLMEDVVINYPDTCDRMQGNNLTIKRKMYVSNANYTTQTVWDRNNVYVGKGNGAIDMSLNIVNCGDGFWLRDPLFSREGYSLSAYSMGYVECYARGQSRYVAPVFHMKLAPLLFASKAPGTKAVTYIDSTGVYTMRYKDVENKISSSVVKMENKEVTVSDPTAGEYLYVQWMENGKEKVKSFALKSNTNKYKYNKFPTSSSDCKIWIEKRDDNLIYAKMFEEPTNEEVIVGPVIAD